MNMSFDHSSISNRLIKGMLVFLLVFASIFPLLAFENDILYAYDEPNFTDKQGKLQLFTLRHDLVVKPQAAFFFTIVMFIAPIICCYTVYVYATTSHTYFAKRLRRLLLMSIKYSTHYDDPSSNDFKQTARFLNA